MWVSWMNAIDENYRPKNPFLKCLVSHGDEDMTLFTNPNILAMIEYLWELARPYFLYRVFLPFFFMTLVPVLVTPLTMSALNQLDEETTTRAWVTVLHYLLIVLLTLGTLRLAYFEILQMCTIGCLPYLRQFYNYAQIALMLTMAAVSYFTIAQDVQRHIRKKGNNPDKQADDEKLSEYYTIVFTILAISFLLVEALQQLKIFDFFASFIRGLIQIIKDSL